VLVRNLWLSVDPAQRIWMWRDSATARRREASQACTRRKWEFWPNWLHAGTEAASSARRAGSPGFSQDSTQTVPEYRGRVAVADLCFSPTTWASARPFKCVRGGAIVGHGAAA